MKKFKFITIMCNFILLENQFFYTPKNTVRTALGFKKQYKLSYMTYAHTFMKNCAIFIRILDIRRKISPKSWKYQRTSRKMTIIKKHSSEIKRSYISLSCTGKLPTTISFSWKFMNEIKTWTRIVGFHFLLVAHKQLHRLKPSQGV